MDAANDAVAAVKKKKIPTRWRRPTRLLRITAGNWNRDDYAIGFKFDFAGWHQ
jgi:hypothetical protein